MKQYVLLSKNKVLGLYDQADGAEPAAELLVKDGEDVVHVVEWDRTMQAETSRKVFASDRVLEILRKSAEAGTAEDAK